eukprot:jgi/Botrbrau1/20304/Bobra.31_1s0081.1
MYNLVSVKDSFQVAALLKEANNAVHIGSSKNGTYIKTLGVEVEGVRIVVSTYADDSSRMTITINDEAQDLSSEIKQVLQLPSGDSLSVAFTPFQQTKGSVLTVSSSAFTATANLVPSGLGSCWVLATLLPQFWHCSHERSYSAFAGSNW